MRSNIEAERSRNHFTKAQLAEKIGVSRSTYYSYLNGGNIPSDKLLFLADLFCVPIEYLLHDDGKAG